MDENPVEKTSITSRDVSIVIALVISIALAILIITWAQEPQYRPLVQDMRLVDAVKIVDVLEQNDISYHADIKNHILYVNEQQSQEARLHLARIGATIEYPRYEDFGPLPQACLVLDEFKEQADADIPIWQQYWFMRAMRLVVGGIVIIVLILSVVKPMLRALIYPDSIEE